MSADDEIFQFISCNLNCRKPSDNIEAIEQINKCERNFI